MRDNDEPLSWAQRQFQEAQEREQRREAAALMGRKGGKKGGKVTQAQRTAKERSNLARKAGKASWRKRRANLQEWREKVATTRAKRRCSDLEAAVALEEMGED